jgi:hypothetical protein
MSSDGSGFRSMRGELDEIELDSVRERETRKRFEDRIAAKKFTSDRLAREAKGPIRDRDIIRRKIDELNQQFATLEERVTEARRGRQAIEREREGLRANMTELDYLRHIGTVNRANYEETRQFILTKIREDDEMLADFNRSISEAEERIDRKRRVIEMCTEMLAQRTQIAAAAIREADTAEYWWKYAVKVARKAWPQDKEEREMIYLEDLRQFLEDEVPDNVSISPPGHRDDSRVQTAGGAYIALALKDYPRWGRAYIQCSTEKGFRFQINHTTLKPGAENSFENLEIEETTYFEAEQELAADMRRWVKEAAKHKAENSGGRT